MRNFFKTAEKSQAMVVAHSGESTSWLAVTDQTMDTVTQIPESAVFRGYISDMSDDDENGRTGDDGENGGDDKGRDDDDSDETMGATATALRELWAAPPLKC